jgi:hypothetical protein
MTNAQFTKRSGFVAFGFFIAAAGMSPGPGSSLGMPWPLFFCTWGVMLVAAFFCFIGYVGCKLGGDKISVFYCICPCLLMFGFNIISNRYDIVRAILHFEHLGY